jgi:hypothetical protein
VEYVSVLIVIRKLSSIVLKEKNEKQLSVCKQTKSCIHASMHLFELDTVIMAKKTTGLRGRYS